MPKWQNEVKPTSTFLYSGWCAKVSNANSTKCCAVLAGGKSKGKDDAQCDMAVVAMLVVYTVSVFVRCICMWCTRNSDVVQKGYVCWNSQEAQIVSSRDQRRYSL